MPEYPCPECGSRLRPKNPVPPGKKLRCPKCEAVFAPTGKAKAATAAAPPLAQPAPEQEAESYGLVQREEVQNEDATRAAFDPIKNRFKLSARGPALILVVRPSTCLLAIGCLHCFMAIAAALFAMWPMIFKVEIVDKQTKGVAYGPQNQERRFKELTPEEYQDRWLLIGAAVFQFAWGAVIAGGAAKMHELKAYPLSLIASAMALVSPFILLGIWLVNYAITEEDNLWIMPGVLLIGASIPFSFWCIATLRNKKVLAGFAEEEPEDF
jgi:hypothetical protein